jgi:hypothetical protein
MGELTRSRTGWRPGPPTGSPQQGTEPSAPATAGGRVIAEWLPAYTPKRPAFTQIA